MNVVQDDNSQLAQLGGSLDFVENSTLDTFIPLSTDLNVEESLGDYADRQVGGNTHPLSSIGQRQTLFFDETLPVYIILQTPYFNGQALRSYIARLSIALEARIVNSNPETHGGPTGHEIVYSGSVEQTEDPLIVVQGPDRSGQPNTQKYLFVLWKLSVFLSRPTRLRLQNPSVVFSTSASLRPSEQIEEQGDNEYLSSQIPSGLNLLEPFNNDPEFSLAKPRLSAFRVSRVTPSTQIAKDLVQPLKNISQRSIRVVPAFSARLRYNRPINSPSKPSLIASLDVDITPFAGSEILIENVTFIFPDGVVEDLNKIPGMALPVICFPRDDVTFMYRLLPNGINSSNGNIKPVQILITARVKISKTCEPQIFMRWQTSIDFTLPVNPGFGQLSQAIHRDQRSSQPSPNSTFETIPTVPSLAISRLDPLPTMELNKRHEGPQMISNFGLTMTFLGNTEDRIRPGELFTWDILIVNHSDRPRKLALVAIPKRRRTDRINYNRPPSMTHGQRDTSIADVVVDDNVLHALQKNAAIEPADIICLSTDVRVGPLAPSACHTVELRFMALVSGIIALDSVRVIDLGTQEHVDIRDLPSIIIE